MYRYLMNLLCTSFSIQKEVGAFYFYKLIFKDPPEKIEYTKRVLRSISRLGGSQLKKWANGFEFDLPFKGQKLHLFFRDANTSDFGIFKELFLWNEYEMLFNNLPQYKHSYPLSIIDAGGNIGLFTVLCKLQWPQAKLLTIEPDPKASELAKQIWSTNKLQNITLYQSALWPSKEKFLRIVNEEHGYQGNASFRVEESQHHGDIPSITLQQLIELVPEQIVHLLKVDIEGSEKYIFTEEHFTKEIASRIETIIVEIHDKLCDKNAIVQAILAHQFKLVANSSNVYLFFSSRKA